MQRLRIADVVEWLVIAATVGLFWTALARAEGLESFSLNACTSGACAPTSTWNLKEKDIIVTLVSGTMNVDLQCLRFDAAGPAFGVQTGITATSAVIAYDRRCAAMRINVTSCTSCVYTVRGVGYPVPR